MKDILIKELNKDELHSALSLVWKVFCQYEAPDYTEDGVNEFYKSIHDSKYLNLLRVFGAFKNKKIIGVIATRKCGTHIALFFVEGKYHKQGIGTQLFKTVLKLNKTHTMTVNSSPYAIPIYHKLDFSNSDTEQVVNGVRFVSMKMQVS